MQKEPEVGGLTCTDIWNGHSGCESLGSHTGLSERGTFAPTLPLSAVALLPAVRFSVGTLACKGKTPAFCLSAVDASAVEACETEYRKKVLTAVSADSEAGTALIFSGPEPAAHNLAAPFLTFSQRVAPLSLSRFPSSLSLSLSHTHVPIIYGCQLLDQLIAGNPLVNRVLDTLPIDLGY